MTTAPEFSRKLPAERIGAGGLEQTVEAARDECAALAARFGVPDVLSLAATFRLVRAEGGRIEASGSLAGRLVRACVVTLEPFEVAIADTFSVVFVPEELLTDVLDFDGPDEIPYTGGVIDLGEAAAEQIALTLDPYPRRPGAALPPEATAAPESPFVALASRRPTS